MPKTCYEHGISIDGHALGWVVLPQSLMCPDRRSPCRPSERTCSVLGSEAGRRSHILQGFACACAFVSCDAWLTSCVRSFAVYVIADDYLVPMSHLPTTARPQTRHANSCDYAQRIAVVAEHKRQILTCMHVVTDSRTRRPFPQRKFERLRYAVVNS